MDHPSSCASCGGGLSPDADRCDLCGTPVGADASSVEWATDATDTAPASTCPSCGHANPPSARFCNRCGTALPVVPAEPAGSASPAERPPSDVGRRALALVGAGVVAVVALYALSLWNDRSAPEPAPVAAEGVGPAAPIPDGPPPPLPTEQQAAADAQEALGTAGSLYEAGRYYLTSAFLSLETNPESSARWAREAAALFERSLAEDDRDDVRLALAEAARFDPTAPAMRPIEEIQTILSRNPSHVGATYMQGDLRLMRAEFQPEWRDSARVSFERVLALAAPDDPIRQQAEGRLAEIAAAAAAPTAPGAGG